MAPNTDRLNQDELEAPDWLDRDFFAKVLRNCDRDEQIEIKSFLLTPGTALGDHYASVMFRANVEYTRKGEEHSKSLILKTMPETEGQKKELLQESFIFETEIGMYTEILPKFEQVLRDSGDNTILKAPCLYHSLKPKKLIVFEDLVTHGYTVLRDRQVNLEEAKLALSKLAKWHAISYKFLQEDPEYFSNYRYGFMTISSMMENDFVTGGISNFIDLLDTEPTLRVYKPHFEALQPHLISKCISFFTEYETNRQENANYVLCHGDFHCKNMMFKNNKKTGAFEDLLLLDFQLSYVGAQVNDLIYSFYMLMDAEMRIRHFDELRYFYFKIFGETLEKIDFDGRVPKFAELREQWMQNRYFDIFLLVTFLPMWYSFRTGEVDPGKIIDSQDFRKTLYKNAEYIKELQLLLPKFLYMGYFEAV